MQISTQIKHKAVLIILIMLIHFPSQMLSTTLEIPIKNW